MCRVGHSYGKCPTSISERKVAGWVDNFERKKKNGKKKHQAPALPGVELRRTLSKQKKHWKKAGPVSRVRSTSPGTNKYLEDISRE